MALDDIDILLIDALQDNARASYRELGDRVGLTPPAVAARMRRLERSGVIRGYTVSIEPAAIGYPLLGIMRVNSPGARHEIDEIAVTMPEVVECRRVTGAESHVLRVWLRDTAHLEEVLDRLQPFGETITNIVTSSPVPRRELRPSQLPGVTRR
jgi:Lrp/AsnC family transcriptional regulator, leucine-responsive regulatory protein